MAFVDGSKLYAVKVVNDKKVLYEVSKDDVRKAPRVDELPEPSNSKCGLIYLYNNGNKENGYICVKSGENDYEWLPLGNEGLMLKDDYDAYDIVKKAGGITEYISQTTLSKNAYDADNSVLTAGGIKNFAEGAADNVGKYIDPNYTVARGGGIVQYILNNRPNWNMNDSGDTRFIYNRPFYENISDLTRVSFTSFIPSDSLDYAVSTSGYKYYYKYLNTPRSTSFFGKAGNTYKAEINGEYFSGLLGTQTITLHHVTGSYEETKNVSYFEVPGICIIFEYRWSISEYTLYFGFGFTSTNYYYPAAVNYAGTINQLPLKDIDLSSRELVWNKVNSISVLSNDVQYPSAKAVYDLINSTYNVYFISLSKSDNTYTLNESYSAIQANFISRKKCVINGSSLADYPKGYFSILSVYRDKDANDQTIYCVKVDFNGSQIFTCPFENSNPTLTIT